jgi:hypothetical protein
MKGFIIFISLQELKSILESFIQPKHELKHEFNAFMSSFGIIFEATNDWLLFTLCSVLKNESISIMKQQLK